VSHAVHSYINCKVGRLSEQKEYDEELRTTVIEHLRSKSEDTFLWVALVCKELEKVESWETEEVLMQFPPGLPHLYKRMIMQIQNHVRNTAELCVKLLQTLTLVFRPLRLKEIVTAVDLPKKEFQKTQAVIRLIEHCGSFLTYRDETVFFVHQSAKDYLTYLDGSEIFRASRLGHHSLSLRLIGSLNGLKKNLCEMNDYGPLSDNTKSSLNVDTLQQVEYACCFWIDHLYAKNIADEIPSPLVDSGEVYQFLQKHFLHWLEALSILDKVSEAAVMIRQLQDLLSVS
jgi:hypothetical protein